MCSKNRIGPKTVPCGTPESTVTRSDCIPSTTTRCLRCFRKLEIQVQILSSMPSCLSLLSKPSCGTVSNALEKSKTAMSI